MSQADPTLPTKEVDLSPQDRPTPHNQKAESKVQKRTKSIQQINYSMVAVPT